MLNKTNGIYNLQNIHHCYYNNNNNRAREKNIYLKYLYAKSLQIFYFFTYT